MRVLLLFLAYIIACLGLAALVVPTVYPWLLEPTGLKPESSLYRFAMLLAVAGMPFFLRFLALNSWQAAGYTLRKADAWRALAKGLLLGIVIMALLNAAQWLLDIRHFAPSADKWTPAYFLRTLLSGLLSGLAVGFIEETFFRGLMHTGMRRYLAFWPTAILTALLYAALHFVKPEALAGANFDTGNAIQMIAGGMSRIADVAAVGDSFITLVVVGIFLAMVRERTGSILWAIGIHAGWVMVIKLTKYLTNTTLTAGESSVWIGSYDNITGWMATLWLATIAAVYWYRSRPKD